jgi:LysR family nitrogen assimilation transcriptional regulator
MITLRRLKYFIKVIETRNITQAAEQLHVAQPALGAHMRELEADFGVALLNRHSRGVEPTPAGLLLQARAEAIFDLLERTQQDIQRMGTAPQLRFDLGLTTSLMLLIGPDLLVSALKAHPGVAVRLHENPSFLLTDALERREIDAALAYCVERQAGFLSTPVLQEQLLLVTKAGPSAGEGPADLAEVLSHDLVLGNERDVARRLLVAAAGRMGMGVRIKYETQPIAGLRELVLRGAAAAILPLGSIAREVERGDLVARPIDDPAMFMTLYVVRRLDRREASGPQAEEVDRILARCVTMIAERLGPLGRLL